MRIFLHPSEDPISESCCRQVAPYQYGCGKAAEERSQHRYQDDSVRITRYTYRIPLIHTLTSRWRIGLFLYFKEDSCINLLYTLRLFRHKNPKEPLILLYRDDPCVIIGRHQNPWKEVNLIASQQTKIPWIRRRSGGGAVYHVTFLRTLCLR